MSRRRPAAATAAFACAFACALAGGLASTASAQAEATGTVSGHVSAGDEPVCVLALDAAGNAVSITSTDTAGDYALTGVPAGSWTVEFDPDDGCLSVDTGYAFAFYQGASTPASATPVVVSAGATTSGIDATLPAGATVGGTVTDTRGSGLPAVCVVLEDTAGRAVLRQPTDEQGNYQFHQLPPGRFIVQYIDDNCAGQAAGYAGSWWPDASTSAAAHVITVAAGSITGPIDAALPVLPPAAGTGGGNGGSGAPGAGSGGSGGPGGDASGTSGTLPTAGSPGATAPRSPGARSSRALLALLATRSGRWTVDRHGRLHLRLRCTHAARCAAEVVVRRPRRAHGRVTGGTLLGRRRVSVASGRAAAITVALHGRRSGRVWIGLRIGSRAPVLWSVIPVRWS